MAYRKRWTEEQKAEALALLKTGLSYYRTAKITGLSDTQLALKFPGYGKESTHHKHIEGYVQFQIPPEKQDWVDELLASGLSLAEVAREAGVNVNHLYARYPEYAYTTAQTAKLANWKRYYSSE